MSDQVRDAYDVVVIGGGAAGLNGALQLARSRRSVLVVDAGQPRNRPAPAVHGLLGHDGVPPAQLLARGRDEVRAGTHRAGRRGAGRLTKPGSRPAGPPAQPAGTLCAAMNSLR